LVRNRVGQALSPAKIFSLADELLFDVAPYQAKPKVTGMSVVANPRVGA
jgi:hypothetical protein